MHIFIRKTGDTRHQLLSLSSKLYGGTYADKGIKDFHFAFTEGEDSFDVNFEVLDSEAQIALIELLSQSFEIIKIEPAKGAEAHEEAAMRWWQTKRESSAPAPARSDEGAEKKPRTARRVTTIYTFFADAEISLGFPRSHDTARWRDMVRQKCGLPTARVEFVQHLEWDAPKLISVDPTEVMAKQQAAIAGIRKALTDRGVSAKDTEAALQQFRATPIQETGRVVYMVPVVEMKEVPGEPAPAAKPEKVTEAAVRGQISVPEGDAIKRTESPTAAILESMTAKANGMANLSMILGFIAAPVSCCLFGFGSLIGIGALVTGVIGLRQVRQGGGEPTEERKAMLGIGLGAASIVIGVVFVVLLASIIFGEGF